MTSPQHISTDTNTDTCPRQEHDRDRTVSIDTNRTRTLRRVYGHVHGHGHGHMSTDTNTETFTITGMGTETDTGPRTGTPIWTQTRFHGRAQILSPMSIAGARKCGNSHRNFLSSSPITRYVAASGLAAVISISCFLRLSMDYPLMPLTSMTSKICAKLFNCLLYTSPSPRDGLLSRMPSSA